METTPANATAVHAELPRTDSFARLPQRGDSSRVRERIAELLRPTGEEDLMAVDYPQPRFSVTTKAALAGGVVAIIACAVWFFVSSGDNEPDSAQQLAAVAEQAAAEPDSAEADSADPDSAGPAGPGTEVPTADGGKSVDEIVVSVVGLVENPGVMTLPDGARAADALAVAHVLPEADVLRINQAEKLRDGQQIVVLGPDDPAPPGTAGAVEGAGPAAGLGGGGAGPISLNTASAAELMSLHGVGEATAAAIIEFRESNGGFASVDQLLEVSGIGPAKFSRLQDEVTV